MSRPLQFGLAGLMLVIGLVGGVLALGNWIGFVFAIPLAAVPFSLTVEWALGGIRRGQSDEPTSRKLILPIILPPCAASVAAGAWQSVAAGAPTVISPDPLLVLLPIFLGVPVWLAFGVPLLSFLVCSLGIDWRMRQPLPFRFLILLAGASVCSMIWLIEGWNYGLEYQGFQFTAWITSINVAFMLGLWVLWWILRRESTMGWRVAFNTLLHLWLFWFAFPWMGELL